MFGRISGSIPRPWSSIENEFAGVLRVAPRRALKAKIGPDGPDKEAFRQVGGIDFVRTIKNEIDILLQSAVDTAEVLLMRHAREPEASATAGQEKTRGISPKTALELIAEMRPSQRFLTIAREHSSEPAAPTEKTIELHEEISPEDPADCIPPNEVDKNAPIEFPGRIDVPAAEPKDDIENRDEIEKTSVARGTVDAAQFKTPIDGQDIADLIARVKNAP